MMMLEIKHIKLYIYVYVISHLSAFSIIIEASQIRIGASQFTSVTCPGQVSLQISCRAQIVILVGYISE